MQQTRGKQFACVRIVDTTSMTHDESYTTLRPERAVAIWPQRCVAPSGGAWGFCGVHLHKRGRARTSSKTRFGKQLRILSKLYVQHNW